MIHAVLMSVPPLTYPSSKNLLDLLPELIVSVGFLLGLLLEVFLSPKRKAVLSYAAAAVCLVALVTDAVQWKVIGTSSTLVYSDSFITDRLGLFVNSLILTAAFFTLLLSPKYLERQKLLFGEFSLLILAATAGMMFLASSESLIMVFLSLEVMSLALYLLAGFRRDDSKSQEAGFKYFILGGFASAVLLLGMAFIYGETGHTQLPDILQELLSPYAQGLPVDPLLLAGVVLLFIGFAFKVSAAPFHMWTPDVYEGAPVSVTAFMSVATKVAAFAALIRLFTATLEPLYQNWEVAASAVAILSMIVGNLVALRQHSLKRMLAYSGVAQAGYMLIGIAVGGENGTTALLVYLAAYTLSTFVVLAAATAISDGEKDTDSYEELKGLAERRPLVALAMAAGLMSLGGFPPLIGFWGKFLIFQSAIANHQTSLAVWGVITSAVSMFYYLRVAVMIYSPAGEDARENRFAKPAKLAVLVLALAVAGIIVLGVYVPPVVRLATEAMNSLYAIHLPAV